MAQVSGAVNPSNETSASFRECVIIRHPRHGEYAIGFITGQTLLQVCLAGLTVLAAHSTSLEMMALYCSREP